MKRISFILFSIVVPAMLLASCQENRALGDWDPMDLSENVLLFDNSGGTSTVFCFNYQPWLHDIHDRKIDKHFYPESDFHEVSAPGISASAANDKIVIYVDPSEEEHIWGVGLQAGNSFSSIIIYQNCKPDK